MKIPSLARVRANRALFLALSTAFGLAFLAGCELIVDFDRTKIPADTPDAVVTPPVDAQTDGPRPDATTDGATDATTDSATDAPATDSAIDAPATDSATDAPADSATDAGSSDASDAG